MDCPNLPIFVYLTVNFVPISDKQNGSGIFLKAMFLKRPIRTLRNMMKPSLKHCEQGLYLRIVRRPQISLGLIELPLSLALAKTGLKIDYKRMTHKNLEKSEKRVVF